MQTHADIHASPSHTQEDICKTDVVTFGCVGRAIIVMMEICTHTYTHNNLFPWHTREENIEMLARGGSMGLCGLMVRKR